MSNSFQICLEIYKFYCLLFDLCFREEIKTNKQKKDFFIFKTCLFCHHLPTVCCAIFLMTLRQRFAIHVRKRPYTFTQTKILFWNLHIANVVLLFVLPVIMFVFFKKNVYFSIIQVSKMALMVAIMRCEEWKFLFLTPYTAQKMKFSIKDFSSKCDFFSFLRIWSHIKKKFLMENFIFCAVIELRGSKS